MRQRWKEFDELLRREESPTTVRALKGSAFS